MSKTKEAKPAKPAAVKYGRGNRKPDHLRLMSITSTIHRKRRNAARYVPRSEYSPTPERSLICVNGHALTKTQLRDIVELRSAQQGRRLDRRTAVALHFSPY